MMLSVKVQDVVAKVDLAGQNLLVATKKVTLKTCGVAHGP
jgi:hypothetical protein